MTDGVALVNRTEEAIYKTYEANHAPWVRMHIGGSDIGRKCDRELWLNFHHVAPGGAEKMTGRKLRLLNTGHREEARLIADLRAAGFQVWDRTEDGKQISFAGVGGHVVVNLDGVILGIPEAPKTHHLLETKTMKVSDFEKMISVKDPTKRGVKNNKPEHYDQMQLGMGLAGLERALYIVHCKDDERIWVERIEFDAKRFEELSRRAARIIHSEEAPERMSKDPAFYYCKSFCKVAAFCHGNAVPAKNCRTCVHASPGAGGQWQCAQELPMQPGCNQHLYRPSMIDQWATPVDGDPTWIKYRINATGVEFVNVTAAGFPALDVPHYESAELVNASPLTIGNPQVEAARHLLDGRIESTIMHDADQPDNHTGMLSINETFE